MDRRYDGRSAGRDYSMRYARTMADPIPSRGRLRLRYHRERDVLSAELAPRQPAVSHDLDGEIWVRLIPATGEIVGFEIEDFTTAFLPSRPEIAQLWQRTRAPIVPRWLMEPRLRRFSDTLLIHVRHRLSEMDGQHIRS